LVNLIPNLLENIALLACAVIITPWVIGYHSALRGVRRSVVFGIIYGLTCLLVTWSPVITPDGAALDARAGPIVMAGFLYGPVAGLIAAVIGSIGRFAAGGPFVLSGVIIFVIYAACGVAAHWLTKKPEAAPTIRPRDVGILFVLSAVGAANMYWLIAPAERANQWLIQNLPLILLMNFLSIAVLGAMLRVVLGVIAERDHAGRLVERLELATSAAGIGIWDYDIASNTISWDKNMTTLHGLPPGSFAGTFEAWAATVHPDDRADAIAAASNAIEGKKSLDTEFRILTPAGEERIVKGAAVVLRDAADQPQRMVGVNYDISTQRRTEREAARRQDQLDALAKTVPGALHNYRIRPDNTHEIDFISDGARDIWEIDPASVKGDPAPIWKGVKPEFVDAVLKSVLVSSETMTPWVSEWQIVTPSGKTKWLEGRGLPRKLDDGSIEWSTIILDVTERHSVDEALARSRALNNELQKFESIGKLSGGIAHDFNNLLAVILGNLELTREESLSDEGRAGLEDAIVACQRGATLTQQLLNFGRRAMLKPEPLNLNTAVAQLGTMIRRTFKENITIDIVTAGGLRNTMLDHTAFDNALLNAALNTRDAMPEGGRLTIETANVELKLTDLMEESDSPPPGHYVMVAIRDTGSGIDDKTLPQVFEPFFTTKAVGEGSGMGLAMVYGFVKQSNGTIRIESEVGVGTVIRLYFPVSESDGAIESEVSPNAFFGGTERVLLVEDEALVRRTVARQLEKAGYTVHVAENGKEALEIHEAEGPFDIMVSDIVMPGPLQGPALAGRIRERQKDIPVIFLSGYAQGSGLNQNTLFASELHLMKPVSMVALTTAIRRVFDGAHGKGKSKTD
jgi:signal transduction histidine kinase/ActR/RegA family two-component response regulator